MKRKIYIIILAILLFPLPALAFDIYVNDEKGLVYESLNKNLTITVVDVPNMGIKILDENTDNTICSGTTNSSGNYACIISFNESQTLRLQGYSDYTYNHYTKFSNPIKLIIEDSGKTPNSTYFIISFLGFTLLCLIYVLIQIK